MRERSLLPPERKGYGFTAGGFTAGGFGGGVFGRDCDGFRAVFRRAIVFVIGRVVERKKALKAKSLGGGCFRDLR